MVPSWVDGTLEVGPWGGTGLGATHPLTFSLQESVGRRTLHSLPTLLHSSKYSLLALHCVGVGRRELPLALPHTSYSFYTFFCFLQTDLFLYCLPLRTSPISSHHIFPPSLSCFLQ